MIANEDHGGSAKPAAKEGIVLDRDGKPIHAPFSGAEDGRRSSGFGPSDAGDGSPRGARLGSGMRIAWGSPRGTGAKIVVGSLLGVLLVVGFGVSIVALIAIAAAFTLRILWALLFGRPAVRRNAARRPH